MKKYENFFSYGRRLIKNKAQAGGSPAMAYLYFDTVIGAQRKVLIQLFESIKVERHAAALAKSRLDKLDAATFKPVSAAERAQNVKKSKRKYMYLNHIKKLRGYLLGHFLLYLTRLYLNLAPSLDSIIKAIFNMVEKLDAVI